MQLEHQDNLEHDSHFSIRLLSSLLLPDKVTDKYANQRVLERVLDVYECSSKITN